MIFYPQFIHDFLRIEKYKHTTFFIFTLLVFDITFELEEVI